MAKWLKHLTVDQRSQVRILSVASLIKCWQLTTPELHVSLAASPSLPQEVKLARGEGLENIALDCVSTDQSDLTEAIRSNFIHDPRGSKPSRSCVITPQIACKNLHSS